MKQFLVLIFITLSFASKGQIPNNGDVDFNEIIEIKGLLYLKTDTTLVTGRVIRYNKKKKAKRFIMVENGRPNNLGWNTFNDKYESPKESELGTLVSVAAKTTGAVMALSGNDIDISNPINNANNINNSIIQNDVDDILDYNKEIAAKANADMFERNDITQNLQSNNKSDIIDEAIDNEPATKNNNTNSKKTGERRRYYSNGKLESKGYFIKGNKEGLWEVYHQNEQLYSKGYYIKGKKDGLWQEYYKNGLLNSRINYKNGKEDGFLEVYHENGQLLMKGIFKDGKQTGEWSYYDENGNLTKTENFDD